MTFVPNVRNVGRFEFWYRKNKSDYEDFVIIIRDLIEELLRGKNIQYLIVQHRVKDLKGFLEKIKLQGSKVNPHMVNDLAALRIICYRTSDIDPVGKIIKKNFKVINIDDKSEDLGVDKMGYKALHIDAALTKSRAKLQEFRKFRKFIFEIQICTALRHTWNEIEHKRRFKAGTELPKDLSREINRLSEIIDGVDIQLDEFSKKVDKVIRSALTEREMRRPLYSSDLARYLTKTFRGVPGFQLSFGKRGSKDVIQEMRAMGLKKILDLRKIMPSNLKQVYKKVTRPDDFLSFSLILTQIMIISYPIDYFKNAWKESHYNTLDNHTYRVLKELNIIVRLPAGLEWED